MIIIGCKEELYDLLIKDGTVVDPSQSVHAQLGIAICRGHVEAIEYDISKDRAREILDASGCVITPGLIDLHVYVCPEVSHYGIDADAHSLSLGLLRLLTSVLPEQTRSKDLKGISSRSQ